MIRQRHIAHVIGQILRGAKTVVVLPADTDIPKGSIRLTGTYRYLISESNHGDLQTLSPEEVKAAGFEKRADLIRWFWDEFRTKLQPGADPPKISVPVLIAQLELDRSHRVKLLHRDSSRGYTTNRFQALPHENEAVDTSWLDPAWEKRSDAAYEHAQREKIGTLSERVRELEQAQHQGFDVSRQLKAVEDRIAAAERSLKRKAA